MAISKQYLKSQTQRSKKYPTTLNKEIVLLSIKPNFSQSILNGIKSFEFRKVKIKAKVTHILVYESSPTKAFVGLAEIDKIIEGSPTLLWQIAGKQGGISRQQFFSYFKGKKTGYAIKIKNIHKFHVSIAPQKIFNNFHAPQSFMYICSSIVERILQEIGDNDESSIRRRNPWCGQNNVLQINY